MSQWPDVVTVKMWTMALRYAVDIHNATPSENGLLPEDIFTGQKLDSQLQDFHTFGSPVFVLHPILANGKQLPKWKPRSRMGMYLGSSPHHARTVPLVLNLRSGLVSPQYHVVFDDRFTTVESRVRNKIPDNWDKLFTYKKITIHFRKK